ncbi:MAG: hypothetical protein ACKVP7_01935 [Hyphomicrobiaceae bacterium]
MITAPIRPRGITLGHAFPDTVAPSSTHHRACRHLCGFASVDLAGTLLSTGGGIDGDLLTGARIANEG